MRTEEFFERAIQAFEVLGVSSMVVGFVFAFALSIVTWKRTKSGGRAFKTLRESLGGAILLGLELLVEPGRIDRLVYPAQHGPRPERRDGDEEIAGQGKRHGAADAQRIDGE